VHVESDGRTSSRAASRIHKSASVFADAMPNFLVIGAPRAGTTWIERHLRQHPQIFLPERKELHFFDREENFSRGIEHYRSFFRGADGADAVGEATPDYLHHPLAPARIKQYLGEDVKLIVSLRDPVERAYSRYWNARGKFAENEGLSFEEKIARKPQFIYEGYYFDHLSRYLEHFDRRNILCLLFDDLKADGPAFMRTIYDFLAVDSGFVPRHSESVVNASASKKRNGRSAVLFYLRGAAAKLRLDTLADKLDELNRAPIPPLAPDTRRRLLHEHYLAQIEALEGLLGRDLASWKEGA
jgi:hypothetical protein